MTPEERLGRRLAKKAERENARSAGEAPLLAAAGLVPLVGVDELRQRRDRAKQSAAAGRELLAELDRRSHAEAADLRATVAAWVTPEVLAGCDATVQRQFPRPAGMGAYVKCFWAERLRLLSAGEPALPPVYSYTKEEQAQSCARMVALKQLWDRLAAERPDLMARIRLYDRAAMREMQQLREEAEIAAGLPPRQREPRPTVEDSPQLGLFDRLCNRTP